jgi:hypothetical protein
MVYLGVYSAQIILSSVDTWTGQNHLFLAHCVRWSQHLALAPCIAVLAFSLHSGRSGITTEYLEGLPLLLKDSRQLSMICFLFRVFNKKLCIMHHKHQNWAHIWGSLCYVHITTSQSNSRPHICRKTSSGLIRFMSSITLCRSWCRVVPPTFVFAVSISVYFVLGEYTAGMSLYKDSLYGNLYGISICYV